MSNQSFLQRRYPVSEGVHPSLKKVNSLVSSWDAAVSEAIRAGLRMEGDARKQHFKTLRDILTQQMDDMKGQTAQMEAVQERKAAPTADASMEVGGGGRFKAMVKKLKKRGDVEDPAAVAAAIGRKKYGKAKFQKMAAKGRKRAAG